MLQQKGIRSIVRIQLLVILVFMVLKYIRREAVARFPYKWLKITLYSFPNLAEGVAGTLVVTGLLLVLFRRVFKKNKPSNNTIYIIAVLLSALYVILQEFRIHNLGGYNVYDPYDVLFSCIGLLMGYLIVRRIQPKISTTVS